MQKELRLKKAQEFSHIYRQGRSWANDLLVLKAMPNGTDGRNRYGFSVGKRTGNAVVRNTIKRRTREAVRTTPTVGGWDMIFIARRGAGSADYHELKASVTNLLRRGRLLDAAPQPEKLKA